MRQVGQLPELCKSGYLNSVLIILHFSSFAHFFDKPKFLFVKKKIVISQSASVYVGNE